MALRHDMNNELILVFDGENETVKIYYAHSDCCFFKTPAMPMVYHLPKTMFCILEAEVAILYQSGSNK